MTEHSDIILGRLGAVGSLVFGFIGVLPALRGVGWSSALSGAGWSSPLMTPLPLSDQLNVLLHLWIGITTFHGILWVLTERIFNWNYGPGPKTPKGWAAAILSLSLTIPLVLVPVIYQMLFGRRIVTSGHAYGAVWVLIAGAGAYVLLFGVSSRGFRGIRNILLRAFSAHPVRAEMLATAAYAAILIGLIAVPYRLIAYHDELQSESALRLFLRSPGYASMFTFGGISTYVLIIQPTPALLRRTVWIHARGIVAGIVTVLASCGALYT